MLGVTNCIGSIPGFVAPAVAAQIVKGDDSNTDKWDLVWMIAIIILAVESVFYIIFAAGIPQPWNFPEEEAESQPKKGKRDLFAVRDIFFRNYSSTHEHYPDIVYYWHHSCWNTLCCHHSGPSCYLKLKY